MKLASLKSNGRDGELIIVDRSNSRYIPVPDVAITMQQAIENWSSCEGDLEGIYQSLNRGEIRGQELDISLLASPLPRAYQWLDGSAYLSHVERVRKARGAEMPPSFLDDPLMYQGGADVFLAPTDPIPLKDPAWGGDFEAEVAVVVDDVPMGVSEADAAAHIKLVMLVNDVSLRNLIPNELAKGFGFIHGKPPTAFSPFALTLGELGEAWREGKIHLPLVTHLNEKRFGDPNAGVDMQFGFPRLVSHAAKTRPLSAGTIIGSGTISNYDQERGCSCLAERRVIEIVEQGQAQTPFLAQGDHVRIEMFDADGQSLFGAIDQVVTPC